MGSHHGSAEDLVWRSHRWLELWAPGRPCIDEPPQRSWHSRDYLALPAAGPPADDSVSRGHSGRQVVYRWRARICRTHRPASLRCRPSRWSGPPRRLSPRCLPSTTTCLDRGFYCAVPEFAPAVFCLACSSHRV